MDIIEMYTPIAKAGEALYTFSQVKMMLRKAVLEERQACAEAVASKENVHGYTATDGNESICGLKDSPLIIRGDAVAAILTRPAP